MKLIIFVLSFCFVAIAAYSTNEPNESSPFYWKEYDKDDIPNDAFGVPSPNGTVYFVGQAFFEHLGLLPGMLKEGSSKLNVLANGRVYTTDKYIKILCVREKENLVWIPTNFANLQGLGALSFITLVVGGTETNTPLYIGRYAEPGFLGIGKIYTVSPYEGLTIVDPQGKITIYKNFEVLAYVTLKGCSGDNDKINDKSSQYENGLGNDNKPWFYD